MPDEFGPITEEELDGARTELPSNKLMSKERWYPAHCPITLRPFFMWLEHPEFGEVPTYGGPFDSYTIPEPTIPDGKCEFHDIEFTCHHYDHDLGGWVDDEDPGMRIANESRLIDLGLYGD